MGGGASIGALSPEDLGKGVANVGKAYEVYQESIASNGISGDILLSMVKNEDENEFKSFANDPGITNKLHQTVLFKKYVGTMHNEENGTTSSTNMFDIKDTLQRPPNKIMGDLFKLQVIALDPSNVAAAVDEIATAIRASVGENTGANGTTKYDVFLSYRVAADQDVAEKLYDKLTVKGFFPFLDKFKLKSGMDWKEGFLEGLKNSLCFVSLVSQKALACCKDKTKNHAYDNVLIEIQTALDYQSASGNKAYIIPVGIGEMVQVEKLGLMLRKFGGEDFGGYADTIEASQPPVAGDVAVAVSAESLVVTAAEQQALKTKAEQEAKEIKAKAERDAAATNAAAEQRAREVQERVAKDQREREVPAAAAAAQAVAATRTSEVSPSVNAQQCANVARQGANAAAAKAQSIAGTACTNERSGSNETTNGVGVYKGADGNSYEGEFKDDKFHGHGVFKVADGDSYEGEYKDDKMHGHGVFKFTSGNSYEGEWKDDKYHGHGVFKWADGDSYEGEYKDDNKHGHGVYKWDGNSYEGEWKDGNQHGHGVYKGADGDSYEGEYKDGKYYGHSVFKYANGDSYEGEFEDGKQHGHGVKCLANGEIEHDGEWKGGEPEGSDQSLTVNAQHCAIAAAAKARSIAETARTNERSGSNETTNGVGVMKYPDGNEYNGEFEDNKKHGHGVYKIADGRSYEGEYRDDMKHGHGVFKWADGNSYEGEYKDDSRHGHGVQRRNSGTIAHDGEWKDDQPVK